MKIVWSKKAENKLDIYFSYCRDNYGDKVTSDKIEKLAKITNRLNNVVLKNVEALNTTSLLYKICN
jgi:hypothetical protein